MQKIIVANWKMNHTLKSALLFSKKFIPVVKNSKNKIIICAPFPLLPILKQTFKKTKISLGAQNLCFEENGAFTGEVSALMLKDFCKYVIVGHSERRTLFHETNEIVNKKLLQALKHNLIPILCIGEALEIRKKNRTKNFLEKQLSESLEGISSVQIPKIIIAYEPIWAIGTGKTATPQQTQEAHAFIRSFLSKKFGLKTAKRIPILYGGSVKPENALELLSQKGVNGLLVGSASLDAESFAKIVNC